MIKTPYYPEDIALTLDRLTFEMGETQDLTEALYRLKAAAENPLNSDCFMALYQTLAELCYNRESGRIVKAD